MNVDRLLAHYERIADASDAVPRLRCFILDLAVRGKLVAQDPNDEPPSISLVEGKRRRPQREARSLDVPGWLAAPVASLLQFQYGKGMKASERLGEGPVPVFGSNGLVGYCETPLTEAPAIIVGRKGSAGALNLCDGPSWATDVAYFVEAPHYFDLRYLLIGLQTLNLGSLGKGVKPGLSRADVYDLPLSIPPLAEQHRIVAKVDELMALCDRLEKARTEREATRDRLTASSLARLDAPDPDPMVFRNHTAFALEHLTPLTTRRDQIKALRQTILNLAVRGKLVAQDPNDEPASELLKRIAKECGKSKKTKPAISLTSSITRCDVPSGWVITDLQSVCASITDGDHLPPPKTESGVPFLVIGNVRSQTIEFAGSRFVSPKYYEALDPIRRPRSGDLLYTLVGSYGIPVVVRDNNPFCVQRHIGILRPSTFIDVGFLARAMESRLVFEQATACATGIAQKTVPLSGLRRLLILLPPRAEQHRIVARVDELMVLCDRLETSLTTADDTRSRLLGALLIKALEPGGSHASEQAERAAAHG